MGCGAEPGRPVMGARVDNRAGRPYKTLLPED